MVNHKLRHGAKVRWKSHGSTTDGTVEAEITALRLEEETYPGGSARRSARRPTDTGQGSRSR